MASQPGQFSSRVAPKKNQGALDRERVTVLNHTGVSVYRERTE